MEVAELKQYFTGKKRHPFYLQTVTMAHEIATHMDGMYPGKLIDERRPSESEYIKKYRRDIWQPVTKDPVGQVVNELMKIRKADDWSVRYDVTKFSKRIREDEMPQLYFEQQFPEFGSVTNWTFSVLLPVYLKDPNAVILVMPKEKVDGATKYHRPFPFMFESDQVLELTEDLAIFTAQRSMPIDINDEDQPVTTSRKGDVYYVIDRTEFVKYKQTSDDGSYAIVEQYAHNLGYVPAFRLKAMFKKQKEGYFLWQSRLSNMLPRLNEALREYSDLQAEVVQHVHSEKWVIASQKCGTCSGTGKVRQGNPVEIVTCTQCQGSGSVATSPYSNLVVEPPKMGQTVPIPIPPAGYIQKQVEIVKIQDERVDKHIYKALCAVSMQYLDKSPVAQSGIAKEVDKESLNNFVHSVAEDLVRIMDRFYEISMDIRYKVIVENDKERKLMLPAITVPSKLDIMSAGYLVDEVKRLKDGKINPIIVVATEMELANKKFASDPKVRDLVTLVFSLDPLAGIGNDEKMSMLQNRGITMTDYVISCNITHLVKQAIKNNDGFAMMDYDSQMQILTTLAKPIIDQSVPVRTEPVA